MSENSHIALKSTLGWQKKATNSSGFSALPGGARRPWGFEGLGKETYWWSSEVKSWDSVNPRVYDFYLYEGGSYPSAIKVAYEGYYVRCVRPK